MNNLVIDIGNSTSKLAVFHNRQIVQKEVKTHFDIPYLQQLVRQHQIRSSIVSSVSQDINEIEECLKTATNYIRFSHQTPLPIHNHYQSPETLGLDRLAAIMGARQIFPAQNTLVIDSGTCITYDLLDRQSRYFGGIISPGIQMRFKALHTFTGRLPLVVFDPLFDGLTGADTNGSILSGVVNGVLEETKGIIKKYLDLYTEMRIVLCGGDAIFFDNRLKNSIFAPSISIETDLVLIGLNEIIHHQHD